MIKAMVWMRRQIKKALNRDTFYKCCANRTYDGECKQFCRKLKTPLDLFKK